MNSSSVKTLGKPLKSSIAPANAPSTANGLLPRKQVFLAANGIPNECSETTYSPMRG